MLVPHFRSAQTVLQCVSKQAYRASFSGRFLHALQSLPWHASKHADKALERAVNSVQHLLFAH